MPGIEKKDINISIEGNFLFIKGEKKQETEEKNTSHYQMECTYGYFSRTIELPVKVNDSKVKAKFKRGVLTITLHKAKESESRKIYVKAA